MQVAHSVPHRVLPRHATGFDIIQVAWTQTVALHDRRHAYVRFGAAPRHPGQRAVGGADVATSLPEHGRRFADDQRRAPDLWQSLSRANANSFDPVDDHPEGFEVPDIESKGSTSRAYCWIRSAIGVQASWICRQASDCSSWGDDGTLGTIQTPRRPALRCPLFIF